MRKILLVAAALAMPGLPMHAALADLVTNGGFEAGDASQGPVSPPSGWSVGSVTDPASGLPVMDVGADNSLPNSGSQNAYISDGTLSQTLATTTGTSYTISFWVAVNDSVTYFDQNASFDAYFGNTEINGMPIVPMGLAFGTYTAFQDTITATSDSTILSFTGLTSNDGGTWYLDDVSIEAVPPPPQSTPEPASLALLGAGLLGIRLARRRTA